MSILQKAAGVKSSMKWSKYIPEPYFSRVTQGFAVPNSRYSQTGHHIGVDHGTMGQEGVPLMMPVDGRITRSGYHEALGYYVRILSTDGNWAFRMCHMAQKSAPVGIYEAGDVIGICGNTGMSTATHLHIDAWKGGYINVSKLGGKEDIHRYLTDPQKLILEHLEDDDAEVVDLDPRAMLKEVDMQLLIDEIKTRPGVFSLDIKKTKKGLITYDL